MNDRELLADGDLRFGVERPPPDADEVVPVRQVIEGVLIRRPARCADPHGPTGNLNPVFLWSGCLGDGNQGDRDGPVGRAGRDGEPAVVPRQIRVQKRQIFQFENRRILTNRRGSAGTIVCPSPPARSSPSAKKSTTKHSRQSSRPTGSDTGATQETAWPSIRLIQLTVAPSPLSAGRATSWPHSATLRERIFLRSCGPE